MIFAKSIEESFCRKTYFKRFKLANHFSSHLSLLFCLFNSEFSLCSSLFLYLIWITSLTLTSTSRTLCLSLSLISLSFSPRKLTSSSSNAFGGQNLMSRYQISTYSLAVTMDWPIIMYDLFKLFLFLRFVLWKFTVDVEKSWWYTKPASRSPRAPTRPSPGRCSLSGSFKPRAYVFNSEQWQSLHQQALYMLLDVIATTCFSFLDVLIGPSIEVVSEALASFLKDIAFLWTAEGICSVRGEGTWRLRRDE